MKRITPATALLFTASALMPGVASAGQPSPPAQGTWDDCNLTPVVRMAGPNAIVSVDITENFQGTMEGSYVGTERDVVTAEGSVLFHGHGVFTGSIDGRTGTATYRYTGSLRPGEQSFNATWVLIGKTGELASATGHGTFEGTGIDNWDPKCDGGEYAGTYQGAFRFVRQ